MKIQTQRFIDRWVGQLLCGVVSAWVRFTGLWRAPAHMPQHPKNILVILLSEMGSIVLAGPMFAALRRQYPGVAKPMNVTIYTEGTGVISDDKIAALVNEHFDLRPKGIIQMLDLLRPIYEKTAAYGHFGREEPEFTWERTDKAQALRAAAGL